MLTRAPGRSMVPPLTGTPGSAVGTGGLGVPWTPGEPGTGVSMTTTWLRAQPASRTAIRIKAMAANNVLVMGPPEFVRLLRNVGRLESSNESVQDIMDSQLKGSKGLEDLFLNQNVGPGGLFFADL